MKKGFAWNWMISGLIIGLLVIGIFISMLGNVFKESARRDANKQFSDIYAQANTLCSAHTGEGEFHEVIIPDIVEAIYVSPSKKRYPENIDEKVKNHETAVGRYLCMKLREEKQKCRLLECDIEMSYFGHKKTVLSLADKILKRASYTVYPVDFERLELGVAVLTEDTEICHLQDYPKDDETAPQEEKNPEDTFVLAVSDDKFTINGEETFLLGSSYFDAKDWSESDFQYLSENGFNLIRIWLDWMGSYPIIPSDWRDYDGYFENDGTINSANQADLLNLVRTAKGHGIVVDVTIMQPRSFGGNLDLRENAVRSTVSLLKDETNVFFDILNEYTCAGAPKFPLNDLEVNQLIIAGRSEDPGAIFTASFGAGMVMDLNRIADLVTITDVDLLAIHLGRTCDWGVDTGVRVTQLKNHLQSIGKNIPIYLQEPQRRGWKTPDCSDFRGGEDYNPPHPYKADFLTAANRAVKSGAASWVFHSYASYILDDEDLYDNFDDIEKAVVQEIRYAAFGQNEAIDMFDSLDGSTIGQRTGGIFVGNGWQPTTTNDRIKFKIPNTIVNPGFAEVEVTNFDPSNQCTVAKSTFLSLYDSSHGNIATTALDEYSSRILLRIGTNYGDNLRIKATPGLFNPIEHTADTSFNPANTYKFRVEWDDNNIWWSLNGNTLFTTPFSALAQHSLDYVFLGRDGSIGPKFGTCPGPIYKNLHVHSYAE